jgi:hypothetical protein
MELEKRWHQPPLRADIAGPVRRAVSAAFQAAATVSGQI